MRDHLGSVDTVVNTLGGIVERLSFDASGKRRLENWQDGLVTSDFNHGYTGHEHDDEVALINMGGRMYEPSLGRFISPDPFVQSTDNMQALNRYAYVLNNPLSYTDPSGFFFKKAGQALADWDIEDNQYFQIGVNIVAAVGCGYVGGPEGAAGCVAATSTAFAKNSGASWNDSLKNGAISAATVYVSYQIAGSSTLKATPQIPLTGAHVGQVIAHGLVGGTASALQGGKFSSGFVTSALGKSLAPLISGNANIVVGTVAAAVIGGTISELTGGKFGNGAQTAAFQYLFNEVSEQILGDGRVEVGRDQDGKPIMVHRSYVAKWQGIGRTEAEASLSVAPEATVFVGMLGMSTSGGYVEDVFNNQCLFTATCTQAGIGLFAGYSVAGAISIQDVPLSPGGYSSDGWFINFGFGPSGGGSFFQTPDWAIGRGLIGEGFGFAVGQQQCQVQVHACR